MFLNLSSQVADGWLPDGQPPLGTWKSQGVLEVAISLMTRVEMDVETLAYSPSSNLTRLLARERFIQGMFTLLPWPLLCFRILI
jgi:hypothetical protein